MRDNRTDVPSFYALHVLGALLPITAAALLYGWASLATIAIVPITAWISLLIWSRVGWRGRHLNRPQTLWMALLLGLILPPHLLVEYTWPIVPAAGILLVVMKWLLGPLGSGRLHPVPAAYLVLVILFEALLAPHFVLKPNHMLLGNLFDAESIDVSVPRTEPWLFQKQFRQPEAQALFDPEPAAQRLTQYTSGRDQPDRFSISFQRVLRDQLPPLEDLILGGEPGPCGTSSALFVIMGGLLLLYCGLIDWRIPLLACVAAVVMFLILPIPVVITDSAVQWSWFAFRPRYLGGPTALTLANYELLASPLLFVAFFLATSPQSRPMSGRGRAIHGVALGLLAAPAQLYGSVAIGPYVALLLVSLASPVLDRLFPRRTLV
jgi:electron transport complex protein RnfD